MPGKFLLDVRQTLRILPYLVLGIFVFLSSLDTVKLLENSLILSGPAFKASNETKAMFSLVLNYSPQLKQDLSEYIT